MTISHDTLRQHAAALTEQATGRTGPRAGGTGRPGGIARAALRAAVTAVQRALAQADADAARWRRAPRRWAPLAWVHLGYADSGHGPVLFPDPPGMVRFVRADLDEAAARLADVIREERADLLLSYDPHGGYGHRDHVKVHEVGARAARLTGTRVLEATVPRELAARAFGPMRLLRLVVRHDPQEIRVSYTPRSPITHRLDVRKYAAQKRAALAAHRTCWNSRNRSARLARMTLAMPVPVFGLLFGREWFVEPGVAAPTVSRQILPS